MAEWVPPTASAARPPLPPHKLIAFKSDDELSPHAVQQETYIVQIPKEQIYRVPPPENAYLQERYRNDHECRKQTQGVTRIRWILGILLGVAVVIGLVILVFYLVVRPWTIPSFEIKAFSARNLNQTSKLKRPEYDVLISTKNKNKQMGFYYDGGGKAVISYRDNKIGFGDPPKFYQDGGLETTFRLALHGAKKAVPKGMLGNSKGAKEIMRMMISVEYPVRTKAGLIRREKNMKIECEFRVKMGTKRASVVSQSCSAQFQK